MPDWPAVNGGLKRKGVTRQLLWREYQEANPDGGGYRRWVAEPHPTMRQTHVPGTAMVDDAGLTTWVVDPTTGELREAQSFVHSQAISHYNYAGAS